jgi:hypothetical protein
MRISPITAPSTQCHSVPGDHDEPYKSDDQPEDKTETVKITRAGDGHAGSYHAATRQRGRPAGPAAPLKHFCLKPDQVVGVTRLWNGQPSGGHMTRPAEVDITPLMAVYEAAWAVVGRYAYALDHEERGRLRCDLACHIARLAASGVDDSAELVRRSILRFLH